MILVNKEKSSKKESSNSINVLGERTKGKSKGRSIQV
jgi:hypothetical protein